MDKRIARLMQLMSQYDRGDVPRINHFLKVHNLAAVIGMMENLSKEEQFTLEAAAILHDIGIHVSEQKYGRCDGHLQEQEGPAEARRLLQECGGFSQEQVERICYLIAHHHTYTDIQGIDYQILVEADFLVNFYEDQLSPQVIENVRQKVFKTATGQRLLKDMYMTLYQKPLSQALKEEA